MATARRTDAPMRNAFINIKGSKHKTYGIISNKFFLIVSILMKLFCIYNKKLLTIKEGFYYAN